MTENERNCIQDFIGILPVIVNAKVDADMNVELLESVFNIPFASFDALDFVERELLPSVKSQESPILRSMDIPSCRSNKGLVLTGFRSVYCRRCTTEVLMCILVRHFSLIILAGTGGALESPHEGALYIDQWKGDELQ